MNTNLPRTFDRIGTESPRIKSPGKSADHFSVPIENHRDKGGGLRVFQGFCPRFLMKSSRAENFEQVASSSRIDIPSRDKTLSINILKKC